MRVSRGVLIALALATLWSCNRVREAEPVKIERPEPVQRLGPPTLRRADLDDVLRKGPGRFFERMPVVPYKLKNRFVGFQIVDLYGHAPPHPSGIHVGDVVTAVNGMDISRPTLFMRVWKRMYGAKRLDVDIVRRQERMRVTYRILD